MSLNFKIVRRFLFATVFLSAFGMIGAQGKPAGGRDSRFSKNELSRMFDKAKEDTQRPQRPNGDSSMQSGGDGEVIVLEPVEVVSDDAELHQKVDRSMQGGPAGQVPSELLRIYTDQNRKLLEDAQYDARASQRFFDDEEQNIGPADVSGTGKLTFQDVTKVVKSKVQKVKKVAEPKVEKGEKVVE